MDKARELLGELAPKNRKQEAVFKTAVSKLLDEVTLKRQQISSGQFVDRNGLYMVNKKLRDTTDGFSKDRSFRKIADITPAMALKLEMKYGKEVLDRKSTKKLVKILKTDPEFEGCLTVKSKTI